MKHLLIAICAVIYSVPALATPGYDQGRKELEWVMERLIEWLPGHWDSGAQIWFEENVRMPEEGEHEHWYRVFERIDAPQVGDVVFYGQIHVGGPDGAVISGSQVLYHAVIDEDLGGVNIFGQGPEDLDKYTDLHLKPELWGEVQMRDRDALNCNFVWRRDGDQIFGVLQGMTEEKRKYGPNTCAFISKRTDAEFRADAEWVLTPESLWLYDNNWMADMLFLGREDQTHIRLGRVRYYACETGDGEVVLYDRGGDADVDGITFSLLRAEYPASDGFGLEDRLRLTAISGDEMAHAEAPPAAATVSLTAFGKTVDCRLQSR